MVPESQWRGQHGPTNVQHSAYRHALTDDFIAAASMRGLPFLADVNGPERLGVGYAQANIQRGRRHSAYDAYVRPNLGRANLQVLDNAPVERVLFEQGRARGVSIRRGGAQETIEARRGVILSLGSLMTPHLLMLSGVGPAQHLRDNGLDVVADRAEVGRNFMDHAGVRLPFTVDVDTLNQQARPLRALMNGMRWLIDGKGPVGAPSAEAIGFFSCGHRKPRPDLQVTLFPFANTVDGRGRAVLPNRRLMNIAVNLNYPESRGHLALRRADPAGQIEIHPRLLDARKDVDTLLDGMDFARDILATAPLAAHVTGREFPSTADGRDASEGFLRANARSLMHPIGTCRMGADAGSVVDPQLRVRGVDGLWVADASIFPTHLTGNIYASVLMVGEKASDTLKRAR